MFSFCLPLLLWSVSHSTTLSNFRQILWNLFYYYRSINFHHTHCRVVFIARSDTRMGKKASKCMNFAHISLRSETYFHRELLVGSRGKRKKYRTDESEIKFMSRATFFIYVHDDIFSQAINWRKWIFFTHESCLAAINFHRFSVCFLAQHTRKWWVVEMKPSHTWNGFHFYKKSLSHSIRENSNKNKTESAAGRNHSRGKKKRQLSFKIV